MFKISKMIRSFPWGKCSSSNTSEQGNLSPHFSSVTQHVPLPQIRTQVSSMFFPLCVHVQLGGTPVQPLQPSIEAVPPLTKLLPMPRGGSHLTVPLLMYRGSSSSTGTTAGEKSQSSAEPASRWLSVAAPFHNGTSNPRIWTWNGKVVLGFLFVFLTNTFKFGQ